MPRLVHTSGQAGDWPGRTGGPSVPRACSPGALASAPGTTRASALFWSVPPPSGGYTENGPRARCGQIGQEDVDALRPIVAPFLGQDPRDIPQLGERGAAPKDPVSLPTAIG